MCNIKGHNMNVQKIFNGQNNSTITPAFSNRSADRAYFGLRLSPQLRVDTVSFQGRGTKVIAKEVQAVMARQEARAIRDVRLIAESKKAPDKTAPTKKQLAGEERKRGVSRSTARKIREQILASQDQIHNFMGRIFGDLRVSEFEPKNIILDISDRAKTEISIMEKSSTRDWNSIPVVLDNMTDLNGSKIVMNYKTGKQEAEYALSRFIPLIKTGQVKLLEIELQRPEGIKHLSRKEQEEFDYFSKVFLDKLEDAQEEVLNGLETNIDRIKLIDRPLPKYTKFNYCALHLLLQLNERGSRPFEMQIMGAREAMGKRLDDKRFKLFDGKELDPIYAPLIALWKRLLPKENAHAKEEFFRYCKDANLQLRKDEKQEFETQRLIKRHTGLFKTVRDYNLTPEYDLNEQYKIMLECESKKAHQ